MKLQTQHRLTVFIALSLSLHLVWFIGQRNWSLHPPQQDDSQMSIHISGPQTPAQVQKKPSSNETPLTREAETLTEDKPQARSPTNSSVLQQTNQLNRARIIGQIRQRLQQHFFYPRLARQRGWQGQVLLAFRLDGAGSIQHVHVKHSSGYAILDDSAIAAMQQVGQIHQDDIGLFERIGQLEIPIIYRLEG